MIFWNSLPQPYSPDWETTFIFKTGKPTLVFQYINPFLTTDSLTFLDSGFPNRYSDDLDIGDLHDKYVISFAID